MVPATKWRTCTISTFTCRAWWRFGKVAWNRPSYKLSSTWQHFSSGILHFAWHHNSGMAISYFTLGLDSLYSLGFTTITYLLFVTITRMNLRHYGVTLTFFCLVSLTIGFDCIHSNIWTLLSNSLIRFVIFQRDSGHRCVNLASYARNTNDCCNENHFNWFWHWSRENQKSAELPRILGLCAVPGQCSHGSMGIVQWLSTDLSTSEMGKINAAHACLPLIRMNLSVSLLLIHRHWNGCSTYFPMHYSPFSSY